MVSRVFLILVLAAASLAAQTSPFHLRGQAPAEPQKLQAASAPAPAVSDADLPADAVVISIRGVCADQTSKADGCVTNITKQQFETMLSAMSFNTQLMKNPVAIRSFADSYVQALSLAAAAEKQGIDKDPQYQELIKIVRIRTLADAYRRLQQAELSKVAPEEIDAYYDQYASRFEQLELDRIFIPKISGKQPKQSGGEFEKKAFAMATQVRERAAKGEDMSKLQTEAYKSLGLTPPLTTDMGAIRRGALPQPIEEHLFALKAGEVSRVDSSSAGYTIYKVRTRSMLPLDRVSAEITHSIAQKKMDAAMQSLMGQVHGEFNQKFFGTQSSSRETARSVSPQATR